MITAEDKKKFADLIAKEKWNKEHPRESNLTHYANELRKIGFYVNEDDMRNNCPVPYYADFGNETPCPSNSCGECQKWWDEEYVPAESVEEQ